jgi:hypothetical protein
MVAIMLAAGPFVCGANLAVADGAGDPTPVKTDGGKYYDKEGNPTFKVQSDGTVDWSTYSGFRRYHSDCHVCHGPDGEGSSYAPALSNYLKTKNYSDFANVAHRRGASGRRHCRHRLRAMLLPVSAGRISNACGMRFGCADRRAKLPTSMFASALPLTTAPPRRPLQS